MITRLHSAAVNGIDGYGVQVEVDVVPVKDVGRYYIVGLPDAAVRESVQRVTSALKNSSFFCPGEMIVTVNLAPADMKKQGAGFDLPIALGLEMTIQRNYDEVPEPWKRRVPLHTDDWCMIGELALDGMVRGVRGVLPQAVAARDAGRKYLMVAPENAAEAAVVEGITVYAVESLADAWALLLEREHFEPCRVELGEKQPDSSVDFDEIKGQPYEIGRAHV